MTLPATGSYVAECFWAGVSKSSVRDLDERADASVAELSRRGADVRYLGSIFMPADEIVLCLFEGSVDAVRQAIELAQIPFERVVEGVHSGIQGQRR